MLQYFEGVIKISPEGARACPSPNLTLLHMNLIDNDVGPTLQLGL